MALKHSPSWLDRTIVFARNFFLHPKMLGSLIPSSRFLINRLLRTVDWSQAKVIVEYGPGVGVFTTEILRRMPADALLVAFETNAEFVAFLRRTIDDSRLRVIHGSAADIASELRKLGHTSVDYIVSGIPYSTMPPEVRDAILRESRDILGPRGVFLVYQFSRASLPYVRRFFSQVHVELEPLNIPPATTYVCTSGSLS